MVEIRTILKKIKPEENCYRYYEMRMEQVKEGFHVQMKWGRLNGNTPPIKCQTKHLVLANQEDALAVVLRKLREKQLRGYR